MKKIILLFVPLLLTAMFSCNSDKVFEQHKKIDNHTWNRFKSVKFNVNIKESGNFDILVAIRHANYYQYKNVNIDFAMYAPLGEERIKPLKLMLRGEDNKFLGDGSGDIWDISIPVFENINLADTGVYRFEIDNVMPIYELPGIMEVGLIIEPAEKK